MKERSDGEILAGLIERTRLLLALADDVPVEVKLQAQPLLKHLEDLLAAERPDAARVRATHALLARELADHPDLDALVSAMEHFVPS